MPESGLERLQKAGVVNPIPEAEAYSSVFNGLSEDEIGLLISVHEKIGAAAPEVEGHVDVTIGSASF